MDPYGVYSDLVNGVTELCFDHSADPCQLLVIGQEAVPICVNQSGQVLIAASRFGKGRVVVFAHEEYLNNPSFKQLIKNAVAWVSRNKTKAIVGVQHSLTNLKEFLEESNQLVQSVSCVDDQSLDVYCKDAYDEHQAEAVTKFVKRGGGLVIGGQALHWAQTNPGKDVLTEFAGNHITGPAGIYFTDQYDSKKGTLQIPREMLFGALWVKNIVSNQNDLHFLLDGVSEFQLLNSSVPSTLLVHGQLAFPVAQDPSGRTFVAAARYGRGRVVVVSHKSYLSHQPLKHFTMNAINWLRQGRPEEEVHVHNGLKDLLKTMGDDLKCKISSGLGGHKAVYCCGPNVLKSVEEVVQFVSEGGGLFIGAQSWFWAQNNKDQEVLSCFSENKYLNRFGISISPLTMKGGVTYKAQVPEEASQLYHFRRELSRMIEESNQSNLHRAFKNIFCIDAFVEDCMSFVRMKAHQDAQYLAIKQTLSRLLHNTGMPMPSNKCPTKKHEEKFLMQLADVLFTVNPSKGKPNHNKGSPPQRVLVNGVNGAGNKVWRSTGLYVPPETDVTINVPSSVTRKQLQFQIGCQTDNLSKCDQLMRPPCVTRLFAVTAEEVTVASLWGGLLYVVLPPSSDAGQLEITVHNAVKAPYFQKGKTSTEEWLSTIRNLPAPWAELETDSVILTVPSDSVKTLETPEQLLQLWDCVMDAIFQLAGTRLKRPERIVADVQIKCGSMHSGYPIMIHHRSIPDILDANRMRAKGSWGAFHELGHNQQRNAWEFRPHTTEATCNLWSVYVHETVLGIPREEAHPQLQDAKRKKRIQDYVKSGTKLSDWKVWTCLETYLQLQEGFGWKPFTGVFKSYLKMSCKDWSMQQKMSEWAEKFSLEVDRNLVPFFQTWGWTIDPLVVERVSKLPVWTEKPMDAFT